MISNAVGTERISTVLGYKLTKGNFSVTSPNLPQRIAILAEANTNKQSGLVTNPTVITSAQQAGQLYGFGSPVYNIMRILRPVSGDGVGGIPTVVYPQAEASGAAARVQTITVTGTATANGTHTLVIAGRENLDGQNYDINIVSGDTNAQIAAKISDAINAVLGCPVSSATATNVATVTTKWKGLTSQGVTISVNNRNNGLGISYAILETAAGSGTPDLGPALEQFGAAWNTIVINSYGTESTPMQTLEQFNGVPDPDNPTGRYTGIIMSPFIALTGSVAEDPSSITDSRKTQVTIAICPAPLSTGMAMEAAANMAVLFSRTSQDTPHLDVQNKSYPDMPAPAIIGKMATYNERDIIVKKGCSTVDLVNNAYQVKDFVTTYHPDGEVPAQFQYCRNLMIDFNVKFGYYLLQMANVLDHAIAKDSDTVTAEKVIKPKQWKQVLASFFIDLARRALIAEPDFSKASLQVDVNETNPNRLDTYFRYKRTGFLRIASTTAEAGFNFGTAS